MELTLPKTNDPFDSTTNETIGKDDHQIDQSGDHPFENTTHTTIVTIENENHHPFGDITRMRVTATYQSGNKCAICLFGCCGVFIGLIVLSMSLALPVTQLVMQNMYSDQIVCESFIQPRVWLITQGVTLIVLVVIIGLFVIGGAVLKRDCGIVVMSILGTLYVLLYVFNFMWLIIGSVMFW